MGTPKPLMTSCQVRVSTVGAVRQSRAKRLAVGISYCAGFRPSKRNAILEPYGTNGAGGKGFRTSLAAGLGEWPGK